MPEVQNVGAMDYAQYQPSQYQNNESAENYNVQPEVYDENMAEIKAANKSRLGATILSAIIVAGVGVSGYLIGKHGKAGVKDIEKFQDYAKKYAEAQKAMEEVEKVADENAGKFFGKSRIGRDFYNKIKELFKPFKNAAEDTKEKADEAAKKAADDAKKTTEDAAKKAADETKEGTENAA